MMGMFGSKMPEQQMPGIVSGYGGGTFNIDGSPATPINIQGDNTFTPMASIPAPQAANPRWLEGGKFTWKDGLGLALGAVGDALTRQPVTASIVSNAFQHQRDLKEAQQQRTTELSDWLWKQQHTAHQPYRWESNDGSLMEIGADGTPRVAYQDPTPKISWMTLDNGDGTKQIVPVGPNGPMIGGAPSSAPTAPVGKLTPIPEGGPTQPASGGFRPYR